VSRAIEYLERSLDLDPEQDDVRERLRQLKEAVAVGSDALPG